MTEVSEEVMGKIKGKIPRRKIGFYPTPIQKLEKMSEKYGIDLYVKREDLTGPGFGGNKIRKLEIILADALEKGADFVTTYGGVQSNSCREVCSVARKLGIKPILFLVGEEPNRHEGNFLLDKLYDADIHFIKAGNMEEGLSKGYKRGREISEELEKKGHRVYDLPLGASTPLSVVGFTIGFGEALKQMQNIGSTPDCMIVASGSGGTQAGMILGKRLFDSNARIIGVNVGALLDVKKEILKLLSGAAKVLDVDVSLENDEIEVTNEYYGEGYGAPTSKSNEAIREVALSEGIILDPVYTAKAMAGLLGLIEKKEIEEGSTVLFWHTGGTPAIFVEEKIKGLL